MANLTTQNIPDLSGKTAIVTGANSGIGYYTAYWLAAKGAQVVLACRNMEKAQAAAKQMQANHPGLELDVIRLDLANLDAVRGFAAVFRQRYKALDILVNNAGVMAIPLRRTADGFEMQFGTNHLGHFALTGLLIKSLLASHEARVITVSSMMHRRGSIDFDNLNAEKSYRGWQAYSQSKLANLLFAYELQRRFVSHKRNAISLAVNPGYVATNLALAAPEMHGHNLWARIVDRANHILGQSAEKGARASLLAATAPAAHGGEYIQPKIFSIWGAPGWSQPSSVARNADLARRLWQISEELTDVSFPI